MGGSNPPLAQRNIPLLTNFHFLKSKKIMQTSNAAALSFLEIEQVTPVKPVNTIGFKQHLIVRNLVLTKPFIQKAKEIGFSIPEDCRSLYDVPNYQILLAHPTLQAQSLQVELEDYKEVKEIALENVGFRMSGHEKVKSDVTQIFWLTFSVKMINKLNLVRNADFKEVIYAATKQYVGMVREDSLDLKTDRSGQKFFNGNPCVYLSSSHYNEETGDVYSSARPKINPRTNEFLTFDGHFIFSRVLLVLSDKAEGLPNKYLQIVHNGTFPIQDSMLDSEGKVSLEWLKVQLAPSIKRTSILKELVVETVDSEMQETSQTEESEA